MEKESRTKEVIRDFFLFFEGVPHHIKPVVDVSTYELGLCDLEYIEGEKRLKVTLRRPGLLIGKQGRTHKKLTKFIDCDVEIIEKKFI